MNIDKNLDEFDEAFKTYLNEAYPSGIIYADIKDFIKQALEEQDKEWIEKGIANQTEHIMKTFETTVKKQLIKELEENIKEMDEYIGKSFLDGKLLKKEDILKIIKSN